MFPADLCEIERIPEDVDNAAGQPRQIALTASNPIELSHARFALIPRLVYTLIGINREPN